MKVLQEKQRGWAGEAEPWKGGAGANAGDEAKLEVCSFIWNFAHSWLLLAPDVRRVGRICDPCGFDMNQKAKLEEKLKQDQVRSGQSEREELIPEKPRQLLVPTSTDKAMRRV